MKVIVNLKLVRRYRIFTRLSLLGMLICLVFGVIFAFSSIIPNLLVNCLVSTALIVACYTLLRINGWLTSRWGTRPRLDEKLTSSLKGLSDDYVIYHYVTDVPHVLLGPNGVFLLEVYENSGKVSYLSESKRWQYTKKGNFLSKLLTSDSFSKPEKDFGYLLKDWRGFLERLSTSDYFTPNSSFPDPQPIIVFSDPAVELETSNSPIILAKISKLKELIRGFPRLPQKEYFAVQEFINRLPGADS